MVAVGFALHGYRPVGIVDLSSSAKLYFMSHHARCSVPIFREQMRSAAGFLIGSRMSLFSAVSFRQIDCAVAGGVEENRIYLFERPGDLFAHELLSSINHQSIV